MQLHGLRYRTPAALGARPRPSDRRSTDKGIIAEHQTIWKQKEKAEQDKLSAQASLWATRHSEHRVKCPACDSDALVVGDPIGAPQKTIKGDIITESQEHLPSKFECVGCAMKVGGLSQLHAASLGDVYKQTQAYDAAEYYAAQDSQPDWEPDNNDPY